MGHGLGVPRAPGGLPSILLQMFHVSTFSPLPGQSALRWASALSPPEYRAPTGAVGSLGPSRGGFAGLGTGQRVVARWVLSQDAHHRGFFCDRTSRGF